jgi:hypothetical protein
VAGKPECGITVRVVLEYGIITLQCSLRKHKGNTHYDEVFSQGWTDHEQAPSD